MFLSKKKFKNIKLIFIETLNVFKGDYKKNLLSEDNKNYMDRVGTKLIKSVKKINGLTFTNKQEFKPKEKKYKIITDSNSLIKLPENYSTDYEEEFKAIQIINDNKDWKVYKNNDKIKIKYKIVKDEEGKDQVAPLANFIFDYNVKKVNKCLKDIIIIREYDKDIDKKRIISSKNIDEKIQEEIVYTFKEFDIPLMSDRDFVTREVTFKNYQNIKNSYLVYGEPFEHPNAPENKKNVRGKMQKKVFYILPYEANKTQIIMFSQMDAKLPFRAELLAKKTVEEFEVWYYKLLKSVIEHN